MNEKISESAFTDPRIAFFDHHAGSWDDDKSVIDSNIRRLGELRDVMGLQAGMDLLEVGCGTGQITPWLCSAVAPGKVTAVDFSQAMLARAQAKDIDAEFCLLDICDDSAKVGLRFASSQPTGCADGPVGEFDVALCFHCFPHFRDQAGALANISAALKPGGSLVVMHLAGSDAINAFHNGVGGAVGGDYLPSGNEWENLLADAGLKLTELINRDDLFILRAVTRAPACR